MFGFTDRQLFSSQISSNVFITVLGHIISLSGPSCSKLTKALVNETLKFQTYYRHKGYHFCQTNVRNFCNAKVLHKFSAKNTTTVDYVSTVGLEKNPQLKILLS